MPLGCLLTLSPYLFFGLVLTLLACGVFVFYNFNVDLFGIGAPDFSSLTIDSYFEQIQSEDGSWTIQYEFADETTFAGKVRHVSPIRLEMVPFLTHDILVTAGDYANPEKVNTSVVNHHFRWISRINAQPRGTINLLHTVPVDDETYHQLLEIRSDQEVVIRGQEILVIEAFDREGKLRGNWRDTGCNTLLVTSVTIVK